MSVFCMVSEDGRESSTLSDRSWMNVSYMHDSLMDEVTNLASEVGAHVCGWLVVDGT